MSEGQHLAPDPRALVELWARAAADRLRWERAQPGRMTGTELNRMGELALSAAAWLRDDDRRAVDAARDARLAALRRSPAYAALSPAQQLEAMRGVL